MKLTANPARHVLLSLLSPWRVLTSVCSLVVDWTTVSYGDQHILAICDWFQQTRLITNLRQLEHCAMYALDNSLSTEQASNLEVEGIN